MKRLFLSSSFKDVAKLFAEFANEDLKGKTVAFIPTASVSEKILFFVKVAKKALEKLGLTIVELEISTASSEEIINKLQKSNYIFVSGGNTFFLLQELKRTGADKLIADEVNRGKIYIGESAGSMILSPNIEYAKDMDNCKKAPDLISFDALHLLDFYPLPHYTNFPFKKAAEKIITKYSAELELYPISNAQAILVEGTDIKVVTK